MTTDDRPQPGPQDALERYADALRASDLDAVLACFTEDAVVMAPQTPTAEAHGVGDLYRHMLAASRLDITFTVEHLVTQGDEAVAFTHSTGSRTSATNGSVSPVQSRESFLLVRAAGAWRIRRYLFNRTL